MEKKKILIVDDEKDTANVLGQFIQKIGKYEVHIETIGSQAYATAKQLKPDLMLLDIMMPNVDGAEVANQMQSDTETKDIPIVFVSGAITKHEAREQGSTLGGYPVLAKPVRKKALMKILGEYTAEKTVPGEDFHTPPVVAKQDILAADRRINTRVQAGGRLSYVCLDNDDNPQRTGMGDAINISKSGIQLVTPLPIDTEYLQLTLSSVENGFIDIKGKVIYSNMLKQNTFQTGINFIAPAEKSNHFVVKLIKNSNLQKPADNNASVH